ncbi:GtrA family protein [Paenibacillus mesophilus]|uniref:GtrA family protein n=1 Tax=Paenibacillus mesophilus TaxID=2582849 RepID=UPI00110DF31F|nr:GtrA family protein [Paenibacillus mesophilus]TMV50883.1 GtrA family protein [Paenibacillus mesophilus]
MHSKLLKYGIVGMFGAFLHFIALILLVEAAGAAPVPASIAGFILTVIVQYGLNRKWTFRSNARRLTEFLRYAAVSVSGLALNALVMYICTDWLTMHYVVGQTLAMTVIPLSNYWLNRVWTFRLRGTA